MANADEIPPICVDLNFRWVKKLKVLGVYFANDETRVHQENFENKLNQIEAIMSNWKRRSLTVKGKVIVVKSLLLPKLTHLFTALPAPPKKYIDKLKQKMFNFLWGGKVDRLRRSSMVKKYSEGGQAMIDIESYIAALKITWVRRHLMSDHVWTLLFDSVIAKGVFLWNRNAKSLINFAMTTRNSFWKETVLAFAKLTTTIMIDQTNGGRCALWFSNETKFKESEIVQWKNAGLHNINDLLDETGRFLTFNEFKAKFEVKAIPLDLLGLTQSLSKEVFAQSNNKKHPEPIIHPYVSFVLKSRRGAKQFYDQLNSEQYKQSFNKWERRWEADFGIINWAEVYESIYSSTASVKLQMLNYKILTKIVVTKRLLFQLGIAESDKCPRCNNGKDSVNHKFWGCSHVRRFWVEVSEWLSNFDAFPRIDINEKMVFLGVGGGNIIGHIITLGKSIIQENKSLSIAFLRTCIEIDKKTEEVIARRNAKYAELYEKWAFLR